MTVSDWVLFGFSVLLILLFVAGFVLWVFAPKWQRDDREHPPRAERVALMQRLRKEFRTGRLFDGWSGSYRP